MRRAPLPLRPELFRLARERVRAGVVPVAAVPAGRGGAVPGPAGAGGRRARRLAPRPSGAGDRGAAVVRGRARPRRERRLPCNRRRAAHSNCSSRCTFPECSGFQLLLSGNFIQNPARAF